MPGLGNAIISWVGKVPKWLLVLGVVALAGTVASRQPRIRHVFLTALYGDMAESEYQRCLHAGDGDLETALVACTAAVAADPVSPSGIMAASLLKDFQRLRQEREGQAQEEQRRRGKIATGERAVLLAEEDHQRFVDDAPCKHELDAISDPMRSCGRSCWPQRIAAVARACDCVRLGLLQKAQELRAESQRLIRTPEGIPDKARDELQYWTREDRSPSCGEDGRIRCIAEDLSFLSKQDVPIGKATDAIDADIAAIEIPVQYSNERVDAATGKKAVERNQFFWAERDHCSFNFR